MAGQFSLDQIRAFIAVAERRSFSKAAEILYLSQPTVSQQIRALERELQVILIERHGRKFALTPEGEALIAPAYGIIREVNDALEAISSLDGQARPRLAMGSTEAIATYVLPGEIGQFAQRFPGCRISVHTDEVGGLIGSLLSHEIDLAIAEESEDLAVPNGLIVDTFRSDEIVLAVRAEDPLAEKDAISCEDLYELPLVGLRMLDKRPPIWWEKLQAAHIATSRLRLMVGVDTLEGVIQGILAGVGAGFVPSTAIKDKVAQGLIKPLRVTGYPLDYSMNVLINPTTRKVKQIDQFLRQLGIGDGLSAIMLDSSAMIPQD